MSSSLAFTDGVAMERCNNQINEKISIYRNNIVFFSKSIKELKWSTKSVWNT